MPVSLHILIRDDPACPLVMEEEGKQPGRRVVVIDVRQDPPDYADWLVKIFEADRVRVW